MENPVTPGVERSGMPQWSELAMLVTFDPDLGHTKSWNGGKEGACGGW
jgi:hypothetical protein